ncbi:MAG TPA: hypothetical protein VL463_01675 [Kofleriaceae bacterium]|nr:hypothetical protein [Kofleriaceae bacterium]
MARLFISVERLENWSAENRVQVDGTRMTLTELGRIFDIKPAVHFLGVAGGDADPHGLVGLVKDEEELAKMGADHMASSVIYVDTAYDVQNGFVGVPLPP